MPLVTNAEPRNQSSYGSFAPRANTKQFGVMFAAIGDGGDGRWPHIDHLQDVGIPVQGTNKSLTYEEYKGPDGKPHDISLPNGTKIREMICPIEDVLEKNRLEGEFSERQMAEYSRNQTSEDGRVQMTGQVTEYSKGLTTIAHDRAIRERLEEQQSSGPAPKRGNPAGLAKAREAKAAKRANAAPATTA